MLGVHALLILCLASWAPVASPDTRVVLGRLQTGATVSFVRGTSGDWGLGIAGGAAPRVAQLRPARLEVLRGSEDIRQLAAGYRTVRKSAAVVDAHSDIADAGGLVFHVDDQWSIHDAVLSLRRRVTVTGHAEGGFASSIVFAVDASLGWSDVNFLAPGLLYGDPSYDGERSPGGTLNDASRRFLFREDFLPAPLFALSFNNGASIAALDPSPLGDTTFEESRLSKAVMTDARFRFGALGAHQEDNGPVEFGFWFPGVMRTYTGARGTPPTEQWIRRYHPIAPDAAHGYRVDFRFGQNESFRDVTRNTWRWAWSTLKPAVTPIDVDQVRRVLTDHMAAQAATIEGRTAIPFVLSTVADTLQWNWTMVAMGFVGKNLECADQLLREGDRDETLRGQRMREIGLAIITSMIRALPTVPLQATGYDLSTGKPHDHVWLAPWLRNATEDMRVLARAYRRERFRRWPDTRA